MTRISLTSTATTFALLGLHTNLALAAVAPDDEPWLHPYAGPSRSDVDASTLDGQVLCGYQGWFNTPCEGKPVVLLWGLGFKDRPWSPAQGAELVEFFKHDSKYGGVYLIGVVDPFWRTGPCAASPARTKAGPRSIALSTRSAHGTPAAIATPPRWIESASKCGKATWLS